MNDKPKLEHSDNPTISCDSCKHFYTTPLMSPTGKCLKYDWLCGYLDICKDWESRSSKNEK